MQGLIAFIGILCTGIGQAILILFILALILPEWATDIICNIIVGLIIIGIIGAIVWTFRNMFSGFSDLFKKWTYLIIIRL